MLAHACNPLVISEEMSTGLKLFTGLRLCMTAPSSGNISISKRETVSGSSYQGLLPKQLQNRLYETACTTHTIS